MRAPSDLDLAALQGNWRQTDFQENGIANPVDELGALNAITTISENRFSVVTPEGKLLLNGTFEIDASTSPKVITWIDAIGPDTGKRLPAIYRLEDDLFVFIAADEGRPRPTDSAPLPDRPCAVSGVRRNALISGPQQRRQRRNAGQ
jgi:uncharacterized protein (TIGR03067 family)